MNNAHEALALKEFFDVACRRGSPPRLEIPLDARPKKANKKKLNISKLKPFGVSGAGARRSGQSAGDRGVQLHFLETLSLHCEIRFSPTLIYSVHLFHMSSGECTPRETETRRFADEVVQVPPRSVVRRSRGGTGCGAACIAAEP